MVRTAGAFHEESLSLYHIRYLNFLALSLFCVVQLKIQFGIDAFEEGRTLSAADNNALMVRHYSCGVCDAS
jgi:hypothetical protein